MLSFNQNVKLLVEEAKKVGFIVDEKFLFPNPNGNLRNLLDKGSYCFGEKVLSKAEDFLDLNEHRIYNDAFFKYFVGVIDFCESMTPIYFICVRKKQENVLQNPKKCYIFVISK